MTEPNTTPTHIDPVLQATLEKLKSTMDSYWEKEAQAFKEEILQKQKPQEQQLVMAFLPHEMAKVSIFFPMQKQNEEDRKINKIEHKTAWGKLIIEGVKLSLTDEDIFLCLMKIARENYKNIDNKFALDTNINNILHSLYEGKGYAKTNKDVVLKALKRFELVSFDLIVGDWDKKHAGVIKNKSIRSIGGIVSGFKYNENSGKLIIHFNPDFFAYFLESMLTHINYTLRRKLKKDGSKALLRFLSAHTRPDRMHLLTVLNAINYNINQPMFELRRKFKSFLSELKQNGVLGPKTKFFKDDTVYFHVLHTKSNTDKTTNQLPQKTE